LFYFVFYKVIIVVVIHFWVPTQKIKKIQKIHIKKYWEGIQKIIGVRKRCWNAHKMARNWLRKFKNTRIKI
jgi:hypothetical protein